MSTRSDLNRYWLCLLKAGGWWTLDELATHLRIKPGSQERRDLSDWARKDILAGNLCERTNGATGDKELAVLPACRIPRGITIGEVVL
jgi:hypothetical protein